jgi:hypothetical protein
LYIYDNSELTPADSHANAVGDFVYDEKDFTYRIAHHDGGVWQTGAEFHIGQKIIAKRIDTTGTVATDWQGIENSTAVRTLDLLVTEVKIRAIVGGNLPIQISPNANT